MQRQLDNKSSGYEGNLRELRREITNLGLPIRQIPSGWYLLSSLYIHPATEFMLNWIDYIQRLY